MWVSFWETCCLGDLSVLDITKHYQVIPKKDQCLVSHKRFKQLYMFCALFTQMCTEYLFQKSHKKKSAIIKMICESYVLLQNWAKCRPRIYCSLNLWFPCLFKTSCTITVDYLQRHLVKFSTGKKKKGWVTFPAVVHIVPSLCSRYAMYSYVTRDVPEERPKEFLKRGNIDSGPLGFLALHM